MYGFATALELGISIGAAFILAAIVGLCMMRTTDNITIGLHGRFNTVAEILNSHTVILKDIASSQKELASSQKEMAKLLKSIDRKLD